MIMVYNECRARGRRSVAMVTAVLVVTAFSLLSTSSCGETVISPAENVTNTRQRRICRNVTIEITVSATVTEDTIRLLQLTWDTGVFFPGDYVAIYTEDPNKNNDSIPEFSVEVTAGVGWVTTDIQETRESWNLTYYPECKRYWAAYKSNTTNEVIASSCLKTEPRWMKDNQPIIGNLTLLNSFIPGTHDSGSYVLSRAPYIENRWTKYIYTQDEDILSQLIYGARFLDIRIGHYLKDIETWWINHSFIRVRPLSVVLSDIKKFIDNTEEIVIVDFHHFPVGFSTLYEHDTHMKLLEYVEEQMGEYLVPSTLGWNTALNTIWTGGKQRVILSYNYQPLYYYKDIVWPAVKQQWGDTNDLHDLLSYLERVFDMPPKDSWSAMTELTPTKVDVIVDRLGGLRNMAHVVNGNITDRLRNRWGVRCNIAAVDFIRSTGVVRAAIAWNKRRARCQLCDSR